MQANYICEYSFLLGYAVAYCGETETYIIYSLYHNDIVNAIIGAIKSYTDESLILLVNDSKRAKGLCNAKGWSGIIDKISGEIPCEDIRENP